MSQAALVQALTEGPVPLVKKRAMDAAILEQEVTGEKLSAILVRNGFIRHSELLKVILRVSPEILGEQSIHDIQVPYNILEKYGIVLVAESDAKLFVACLASQAAVRYVLKPYFPHAEIEFLPLNPAQLEAFLESAEAAEMRRKSSESGEDSLALDRLIHDALKHGASDLHFEPHTKHYTCSFRLNGVIEQHHAGTLEEYGRVVARLKDRARMDIAETRIDQGGSFSVMHMNRSIDMRVASMPLDGKAEGLVVRVLDGERINPDLNNLGITRIGQWRKGTSRRDGLCLIVGETGSGKTTTLSSTVRDMDRFGRNIVSIEDPVELRIPFVKQVSINPLVGMTFPRAIRGFMRYDPNVIVLGEVRDEETALNAVRASETGHLVLATLHAGSIGGTVARLRDMGVPVKDIRHLLRTVLVQMLVRTVCGNCGGAGCENCLNTGYDGRVPVSECVYFESESDVDRLLAGEKSWTEMKEDAIAKMHAGITDERELRRVFGAEIEKML